MSATTLSTAALAALTLSAGRRAALAWLTGLELSSVGPAKAAADAFDLELLFVSVACSSGSHLPLSRRFNGGELPTNVLIDARGYVRRRFIGGREVAVFEAMIRELAAESALRMWSKQRSGD